ncbi:sacsin [Patella vulgata]|uniref:sacsin n=1 Tax=Patella vulgata TaxID=6465 RepID=UPI0021804337|nr:sacsin [Patella vulgata]
MEEIRIQLSTKETENSKTFLISWGYGIGKALSEAEKPAFKGLLPVAATAIQSENHSLSVDKQKVHGFYHESHLFCFLPLPVKSELPVHVNASFAVLSSRKELAWRNEDDLLDSAEDQWNKVLLEDAGSQSYIHMLTRIARQETRPEPQDYYNIWPSMTSTHKHDQILSHHIYLTICEGNYNVFLTPQLHAVSLKQSVFLDPKLRKDTTVGTIAFKALQNFLKSLKRGQVHPIDLPSSIWENFEHAECLPFLEEYVISIEEFYSIIIFPHLLDSYWLKEDLDKILLYGLNNGSKDLLILFSNHECIPTKPNGKLARPSKLIHPKGELAKLFSESEECFPEQTQLLSESFNSSQSLEQLELLGMQVDEFSDWELLSERIYVVLESGDYEHIKKRCIDFLRYLSSPCTRQGVDQTSSRYQVCPGHVREKISSLRFLPRLSICQKYAWCKKTNTSEFISATEGYLPELIDLVGCILPIVDTEDFKYRIPRLIEVLKWLGVRQETNIQSVVGNLLQISHDYITSEPKSSDVFYALEKSVLKMYDFILSHTNDEVNTYIVEKLSNAAVILQDTTMKKPQEMVLNLLSDLSPYLYTISPGYKKYSYFFCLIGVTEKLTISKILEVLVNMSNDKGSEELSDAEITCMVHLTESLPELLRHNVNSQLINLPDNKIDSQLIKLPDNENKLTPIKNLWFDDTPWLKYRSKNIKPLHEKFTKCVARSMGVQSKRDQTVNSLSKTDKFFQFGQHEDLTSRIHRILESYPRDESVLKEILQNADDAGATEVIFIKDFRNLPAKSLPNEEWSDMQGPALCIYNDSYFTKQDLKGIQDLGIGTKRDDVLKTGQYGVGFNVVYHITDAPSFWSKGGEIGEVVCVFDPHCKYVSMATPEKPGMMIDAEDLHETFADFHTGYLPMLTRDKTQGTLFRLPLRTEEMALTSKISDEVSKEHIEEVIELLKDQVFSCMIFLENIKKVKIGSIMEEELVIEYEVASTMSGEDVSKQEDYNDYLKAIAVKIKQREGGAFSTTPKEISITLQITDNMKKKEDYLIVKRAGFLTDSPFPEKLQNAYENGQVQKLPRGGVAIVLSPEPKITGKAYCTLPLPVNTGLPVHVNGQFALDHESRRNLWKGENSVQFLWNWQLGKSLIVPAYISALQEYKLYPLPAREYSMKNTDLIQMIQQFESLFPKKSNASDIYWKDLVESIYHKIAKDRFSLFPVILDMDNISHWFEINWVPVQIDDDFAGCFNTLHQYYKLKKTTQDATFFRSSALSFKKAHSKNAEEMELTHQPEELEKILVTLGMKVLKSASWIRQEIEGAKTVSPELVLKFLKSHANQGQPNGCILGELPEYINQTTFKTVANLKIVFEFVMKAIDQEYSQNRSQKESESIDFLYGAPLLLKQNHQLSVFSEDSIVTVSKFCDLLPEYSNRFLSLDILPILEDYVSVYQPLKQWSIAEFAGWCNGTELHRFIGQGTVMSWSGEKPVSELWLVMLWKFLNYHILNSADDCRSKSLENHLNPVKSFSILPVEIASNTFQLYPLSQAEHVIDYVHLSSFDMPGILVLKNTEEILKNLRFPNLRHFILDPTFTYRACEIVADMKHPIRIIEVLYTNSNCLESIDTEKAKAILQYFNVFKKEMLAFQNKLKQLKLYETHDGELITLDMPKTYIRLLDSSPPQVPSQGLQHWSSVSNVIILKRHSKLDDLFKTIGIEDTSPTDLYLTYILKWFNGFKDEDQSLYHLKYIRDKLLTNMEEDFKPKREALIKMLTEVKFISYRSVKRVASSFYDNKNEVFKEMHELLDFPPPPFNDPTWRQFLIHAGLICKVSEENFVFFAETIAKVALSNGVTDKLKNQSQVLVNYLFEMKPTNNKSINNVQSICTRIKSIKFLEQESLQDDDYRIKISSQFGSCRNFIEFQNSYDYSHFDLIWSVKNVLKRKNCDLARQNGRYINWFKLLGISKTVDSTTFIRNMQNVCSSLTDKSVPNRISLDNQKKLFETYYKFLQGKLPKVREELTDLKDYHTIFLPDDGLLVPASSVILESSPDYFIDGHIFKAPIYYGKYFDVFEALGVRKSAIPDVYLEVLCCIEENCNGEKLDPNESLAVQKCIKQLNILWKKHADQKYELKKPILFLPNQQNVLTNSTELVFIDDNSIYHRTKQLCIDFFIGYKCLEMEVPDPNSIHRFWPEEYQMKRLSKIVKEGLNQDCIQGAVYGELANEVSKRLKHDEMLNALMRLLKHDQHKSEIALDDEETMKKKLQTIVDIKICEVKCLSMELIYQGKVVPNSECKKLAYFVESSQQNKSTKDYILYVNQGISVENYELKKTLFALLKRILNISIQIESMLFSELWGMNHSEISEFLNNRKIIHFDYAAIATSIFPELGTEIPTDLHFLLNNGFSEFYEGEYVGFEVFDPDLEETNSEDVEYSPMYIYAKIVKKVKAETDEEFATFSIDVGDDDDVIEVYFFKIYKFHRTRKSKSRTLELSEKMKEDNLAESSQDITTILQGIRKTLMKAWKLPEIERKTILKRLILLWHPDKNLHDQKMATEVTQKIFMYVNRLKNGLSLDEVDETDGHTSSSNYYSDDDSYGYFYNNMHSRGRSYARNFQDHWSDESYDHHHTWIRTEPRPMPDHAVRWLKQAVSDLKAAELFQQNIGDDFHNWVCYKCQQAAEKALKAVLYTIDGNKVTHEHNVYQVACGLPYDNLKTLALELQNMIGYHTRMRYPDTLSYPQIPNDVYNKDHSQRGCEITRKIVNGASEIIN